MDIFSRFELIKCKIESVVKKTELNSNLLSELNDFEDSLSEEIKLLRNDRNKYKMLFHNAGDSIFIQNENGRIIDSNLTATIQYQYSASEMLSLSIIDIDVRDQHVNIAERVESLMKQGYLNFESVHKRKDGSTFPVDVSARRIIWDDKNAILSICRDITKRKETEKALIASESKLRQITNNMTDVVWTSDLKLNTTYVSPSIERLVGYTPEEQLTKTASERFTPETFNKVSAVLQQELAKENDPDVDKNRTGIIEIEQYKADGTIIPLAINIRFIRDNNGKPIGLQGVSRDITDLKTAENKLMQKINDNAFIARLSFLLADNTSNDPIKDIALAEIKKYTNAAYAQFTIFNSNQNLLIVNHIEADDDIIDRIKRAGGEKIFSTITRINKRYFNLMLNSEIKIFESLAELSFGVIPKRIDKIIREKSGLQKFFAIPQIYSGVLYGATLLAFKENQQLPSIDLLKSFSNILAVSLRNKIAEDKLIDRENQIKSIANNLVNGMIYQIVAIDSHKRNFTFISENVEKFYGCSVEQAKTDSSLVYGRVHKDDIDFVVESEQEALKTMSDFKAIVRVYNPDGSIRWSYFNSKPNFRKGQLYWDGIEIDITEQKNIENELRKLNQEKDLFMRLLAHDLRSPFSSLIGFSDLMIKNLPSYTKEKIAEQLALSNKVVRKTYNLLDNMLLWAKSQSGLLTYDPKCIVIEDLCHEVLNFFKEQANSKSIDIYFHNPATTKVFADSNMIQLVFRNLISNAIKFTARGGKIIITVMPVNGKAEVTVSDNGIGIAPCNIERLWSITSFYSTLGTEKEMGTGLGLLLSKDFIEKNGGNIWVNSELGKGTDFTFNLPIANCI